MFNWSEAPSSGNNSAFSVGSVTGGTFSFNIYYKLIHKVKTGDLTTGRSEIVLNDDGTLNYQQLNKPLVNAAATGNPLTSVVVGKNGGSSYGCDSTFDWIIYRKYASPEPTISAGATEATPTTGYHIYVYPKGQIYQQQGSGINK